MAANSMLMPPQNLEVEQSILGGMIVFPDENVPKVLDALGGLDAGKEHFYATKHSMIFQAIVEVHKKKSIAENMMIELIDYLGEANILAVGGPAYLSSCVESFVGTISEWHLGILKRCKLERERMKAMYDVLNLLRKRQEQGESEVPDFLAQSSHILETNLFRETHQRRDIKAITKAVFEEWMARMDTDGLLGLPSHIPRMNLFTGGWVKDRLIVLGGRPGMGKTSLVLQECDYTARKGGRVLFVSLEMSDTDLVSRVICQRLKAVYSELQINPKKFKSALDWPALEAEMEALIKSNWIIIDQPGMDGHQVCAAIESENRKNPLSLVAIDYLQLVTGMSEDHRVQAIADFCAMLKAAARRTHLPIILISQLSRALEQRKGDKRPTQADLRDSGGIEQAADQVIFTYRDYVYNKKLEDEARMVAELIIAKNRFGPCGTVHGFFHGPTTRFFQDDHKLAEIVQAKGYPTLDEEWLFRNGFTDSSGSIIIPRNAEEAASYNDPVISEMAKMDEEAKKDEKGEKAKNSPKAEKGDYDDYNDD